MQNRRGDGSRTGATRERIITAAERLFAERGVVAVSNRQISEAAGQGNNTAVGYHFGSKEELVRAIVRRHTEPIERARMRRLAGVRGSGRVRDWVGCLVHPATEHLAELGVPSWFARFSAQVMTDPGLREVMVAESLTTPALRELLDGLSACADLPLAVHLERSDMAGQLVIHMCAQRERQLARDTTTPKESWHGAATGLVEAITAIWLAPVVPVERDATPTTPCATERDHDHENGGNRG